MISYGFCYGGGEGTAPGYRQNGACRRAGEAERAIKEKLAGKRVEFKESGGKLRAYADGVATGYIYFVVSSETWSLIDLDSMGNLGEKAVIATGDLAHVKQKAREYAESVVTEYTSGNERVRAIRFQRTGDNMKVLVLKTNSDEYDDSDNLVLVRING